GMKKILELRGQTAVFVDWANVHGWQKSLKKKVDLKKLFAYVKSYKEIKDVRFYFGSDKNEGSKRFMKLVKDIGYTVVTKPVKQILVEEIKNRKVYKRKCDFDMEICIDVHQLLKENYGSFIFFTGDGDFEPLYQFLIGLKKQIIVIFAHGHMGREVYKIEQKIFIKAIDKLEADVFF
ncbi:NYN domain-containing protein, partial [Candidatus Gottesmanbacteria bacterium]|nr:NYN domain-containing protein [Candidatus Gottesmanbacteria bacterium]